MRILFVFDSVEAPAAANPRLGRRLAEPLAAMGHQVEILELWDGAHAPPAVPGCVTHDLPFADEAAMNRALENWRLTRRHFRRRCGSLPCMPPAG